MLLTAADEYGELLKILTSGRAVISCGRFLSRYRQFVMYGAGNSQNKICGNMDTKLFFNESTRVRMSNSPMRNTQFNRFYQGAIQIHVGIQDVF